MPVLDSKTTTTTAPVLYRCKPCKKVRRVVYTMTRQTVTSELPTGGGLRTSTMVTAMEPTGERPEGVQIPGWFNNAGREILAMTCSCGRHMTPTMVRGRFSAVHKCGARCLNAVGGDCECSCAGKNHGGGHG